jgi:hypothetical protein
LDIIPPCHPKSLRRIRRLGTDQERRAGLTIPSDTRLRRLLLSAWRYMPGRADWMTETLDLGGPAVDGDDVPA